MDERDIPAEPSAESLGDEWQRLHRLLDLYKQDRQLIAYEIHDGMAQHLTAAQLHLQTCRRLREQDPQQADKSCETALRLLARAIGEARQLIRGLQPSILEQSGLVAAVDHLIQEHRQNGGPTIDFSHDVSASRLPPPLENAAYRIIQESLSNACRYSRSTKVRAELIQTDSHIYVHVRDWGIGFDAAKVDKHCCGLRSIRQRARMLGGQTLIKAAPGQGTQIAAELPLV